MKKHNFYAGPAVLPQEVLEQAAQAVADYQGKGISLVAMSHRSSIFVEIMEEARQRVKDLLQLDDSYNVLFLQGGASTQFFTIPFNMLDEGETAGYLDTGSWASKAMKEASFFGNGSCLASSKEDNYNFIPKNFDIPGSLKYFHYTSNNTIYGTQVHDIPDTDVSTVVDMSSDLFHKPVDGKKFDLIYAGAQKNLGPAGTTIVAVKESVLGRTNRKIPTMIDYRTHIGKDSMFNTPPVFAVYSCLLTMRWIEKQGGLSEMQRRNEAKAKRLYDEIDRNPLFKGTAALEDRSLMNVTFVMNDSDREKDFLSFADSEGILGIKGHRSVGGFRASTYNALPEESVDHLIQLMQQFEKQS